METHNTKSPKLQSLYTLLISFLLILLPSTVQAYTENTSFSLSNFTPDMPEIYLEGDAYTSDAIIGLTEASKALLTPSGSVGRATYAKLMHLWDKPSRNLADFTTHFSFVINSEHNNTKGNGFAFFLAPNGSRIPPSSGGPFLGLQSRDANWQSSFIAVEFDTAWSENWDPAYRREHIGIDVNTLSSAQNTRWYPNEITTGGRIEAWITYNSSTKNLSVSVVNGDSTGYITRKQFKLSYVVDLTAYLPEWITFGFSAATTSEYFEKHEIYSWEFKSILQIPENITNQTNPQGPQLAPAILGKGKTASKLWLWVILGVGAMVILVSGLAWFSMWRKRGRPDETNPSCMGNLEMEIGPRSYLYNELVVATNNFSTEGLLGKGGFGNVYVGFLGDRNSSVAVKRITAISEQGLKEYVSEVKTISRLRHRNLVQLIGWCHEKQEFLIVYQFLPNRSLDYHLFREQCFLTWEMRYRIALGLASALFYLQQECEQYVLHRDIKSSNVLLDLNFNAKLGDFGLARLVDHGQGSQYSMTLVGTDGYVAPEYLETGKASKESDVYSFGIVALEIACGKPALQDVNRNGVKLKMKLVNWVWEQYGRGNIFAVADPRLGQFYVQEQMERLIVVGLACANPSQSGRLSIGEAIDILNAKAPLPMLPSQMPIPENISTYHTNMFTSSGSSSSHGAIGSSEGQAQPSDSNCSVQSNDMYRSATCNSS